MRRASVLRGAVSLVEKPRDQTSIKGIGLRLLADEESAPVVKRHILKPRNHVAVAFEPGRHRPGIPTARGFAADRDLSWRQTQRAQPFAQLAKTTGAGWNVTSADTFPAAVFHSFPADDDHHMLAAPNVDSHLSPGGGRGRVGSGFSQGCGGLRAHGSSCEGSELRLPAGLPRISHS